VIERYASRWSVEIAIEDAKQIFGTSQARDRTPAAVRCTVPFELGCQSLAMVWYATAGHHPADADDRRARAPWYTSKPQPSTADMIAKLRRVLIAAKSRQRPPCLPSLPWLPTLPGFCQRFAGERHGACLQISATLTQQLPGNG
jgi:hypothetical protein